MSSEPVRLNDCTVRTGIQRPSTALLQLLVAVADRMVVLIDIDRLIGTQLTSLPAEAA